jgi:hypothetical protein
MKARGKHGDRALKGKARTPSLEKELTPRKKPPVVVKNSSTITHQGNDVSDPALSKNPKGKPEPLKKSANNSLGPGISSKVNVKVPETVVSVKCVVPGFPTSSTRSVDGSVVYTCMDDTGGTWTFLGAKDEVLVTWKVYDSLAAEFETGSQEFVNCTHFNQVIRTLGSKYRYSFLTMERDERRDFSKGGDLITLRTADSIVAPEDKSSPTVIPDSPVRGRSTPDRKSVV